MNSIKPARLKNGDLIGIISPASAADDISRIEKGLRYIEGLGYRTILGKNLNKSLGYLAGTDDERIADIHQMFSDKNIKAIFCLRGGYGAFRLLDKIDYKVIRNNPKIFVGYSEITALQMAFLQKTNLVTFAGPMVVPDFSNKISKYTEENFWRIITSNKKVCELKYPEIERLPNLIPGNSSGKLIGGNLAVLVSLSGSGFLPNFKNKILFLEEISEPPYKIDRMFNQLKLNSVFKYVRGVILGSFTDCCENDLSKKTLTLNEIMKDYFTDLNIPVVYNFPHGHIKDFMTLPIGIKLKLNASKGSVELTESCVR